jgi:hypothetical protein
MLRHPANLEDLLGFLVERSVAVIDHATVIWA